MLTARQELYVLTTNFAFVNHRPSHVGQSVNGWSAQIATLPLIALGVALAVEHFGTGGSITTYKHRPGLLANLGFLPPVIGNSTHLQLRQLSTALLIVAPQSPVSNKRTDPTLPGTRLSKNLGR